MAAHEYALPESLRRLLAGETLDMSFSTATWGVNFPDVSDLDDLPRDAKIVAIRKGQENLTSLRRADQLVAIKTGSTTSAVVHELSRLKHLRMAFLINIDLPDEELRLLSSCRQLEHLLLYSSRQLTNLGFLADLQQLRTLFLHDLPKLDLSTLPPLGSLREFVFHGGFNDWVKIPSLAPLAALKGLQSLELSNVRATDDTLAPLAALQELKHLFVPTKAYEVEEYARLSASLPLTRGVRRVECLKPVCCETSRDTNGQAQFPCAKCGQPRVVLTGKGTRMSCLICDSARIEKHIERWERARQPF